MVLTPKTDWFEKELITANEVKENNEIIKTNKSDLLIVFILD
jgi:hypothetical protein